MTKNQVIGKTGHAFDDWASNFGDFFNKIRQNFNL